jgi:hypothetical protein
LAEPLLRKPTTGIAACCARAVSGHAITVLLKSVMNSRRLMGFTPVAENHLPVSLIRFWCESYAPHCSKEGTPMSALGQKQTWRRSNGMSALHPKADIAERQLDVRFVPKADMNLATREDRG